MNKHKHLTLDDRKVIEAAIVNGSTKSAIAKLIGKDSSTIAKEIHRHRIEKKNTSYLFYSDCALIKQCGRCDHFCSNYVASSCKRRDSSPGACNGCRRISACHLTHFKYHASIAHNHYTETLSDSRLGIDFTTSG